MSTSSLFCAAKPTGDGMIYGNAGGQSLTMDRYAAIGARSHPIAIIIHGGGFVAGTSKNGSEAYCAEFLAPAGYDVFSINYRLAPKYPYPAMVEDVQRAVRFVRFHANEWGDDPAKIALVGGSAGGFLSNMAGLIDAGGNPRASDPVDRESARVQAAVTLFGVSDFRSMPPKENIRELLAPLIEAKGETAALEEASPIAHVRPGTPPFLLIHGDKDEAVPFKQSSELQRRIQETGGNCDLIRIPNGMHATGGWYKIPGVPDWERQMTVWLNGKLGHAGPIGEGIRKREPSPGK